MWCTGFTHIDVSTCGVQVLHIDVSTCGVQVLHI